IRSRRHYAALFISDRITGNRHDEHTFNVVVRAIRKLYKQSELSAPTTKAVNGSLGKGVVRSWTADDGDVELRATLIPICNGTASVVFLQIFDDDDSRKVMDTWLRSFHWTNPGQPPPACKRFDPQ